MRITLFALLCFSIIVVNCYRNNNAQQSLLQTEIDPVPRDRTLTDEELQYWGPKFKEWDMTMQELANYDLGPMDCTQKGKYQVLRHRIVIWKDFLKQDYQRSPEIQDRIDELTKIRDAILQAQSADSISKKRSDEFSDLVNKDIQDIDKQVTDLEKSIDGEGKHDGESHDGEGAHKAFVKGQDSEEVVQKNNDFFKQRQQKQVKLTFEEQDIQDPSLSLDELINISMLNPFSTNSLFPDLEKRYTDVMVQIQSETKMFSSQQTDLEFVVQRLLNHIDELISDMEDLQDEAALYRKFLDRVEKLEWKVITRQESCAIIKPERASDLIN